MTDNTMRAAEPTETQRRQAAWRESGLNPTSINYTVFKAAWNAAKRDTDTALAAARAEGYKAGMEKAAEICEMQAIRLGDLANPSDCACAIRAEIDKEGA